MKKVKCKKEFVEKANAVYNSNYDYTLVRYVRSNVKVCIICPHHGIFRQTPSQHLLGSGCPYCKKGILSRKEYLEQVNEVHNNLYDYKKCDYSLHSKKSDYVIVTCEDHGDFPVKIGDHLKGKGCPKCYPVHMREKDNLTESYRLDVVYRTNKGQVQVDGHQFQTESTAREHLENLKIFCDLTGATIQSADITKQSIINNYPSRETNDSTVKQRDTGRLNNYVLT